MARNPIRRRQRRPRPPRDELPRLAVHVAWGSAFALAYWFGLPRDWAIWTMGVAFAGLLVLEALRINYRRRPEDDPLGFLARSYARLGRRFMRTHERRGEWVAALASVAGYFVVLVLFPKPVAVAGILACSLGDPAARLIGRRFGTTRIVGRKTLAGTGALLAVAWLVCRVLGFGIPASVAGAVAAALADVSCGTRTGERLHLDDNFVVPVVTALALRAVSLL